MYDGHQVSLFTILPVVAKVTTNQIPTLYFLASTSRGGGGGGGGYIFIFNG